TRDEQDQLAMESHQKAVAAYQLGFYSDLVVPYKKATLDTIVRPDTSLAKLAKLKPAFDTRNGSLTAGNSTTLTDGAAAVFLASERYAEKNNLIVQSFVRDVQ